MTLIETRDLSKSFGAHKAVERVSFSVGSSTIVGLLGSNGAGKSTTMRMLAGTLGPDSGSAAIAGYNVASDRLRAARALGYLPEAANGLANLTVDEFLRFAAQSRGLRAKSGNAAVRRILEMLALGAVSGQQLGTLSKGWRQRAWLAQALIHDPPVLILDEPTDGLDPKQKVDLRRLLKQLSRDRAILMSTHIVEEAEELCDRLIVMNAGQIVSDSIKEDLLDDAGRLAPALIRLTSAGPAKRFAAA
ncbi:MAG: ABC transporter ATP-binding protein [Alphaproteobacteria bacterium]|nr:ABC transporter ATP-binding protein [Alphaproteobacteria bacterium]